MTEIEKLADCPECKSGNTIMGQTFSSDGVRYMVCCGKCGANSGRYELKADAAAAWSQRPIFPLKALEAASKEIGHQVRVEIYALAEDTLETCHAKANDGGPDDHEHGFLRGRLSEAKSSSRALGNVITDQRIAAIMSLHLGPDATRQHATALEIGRGIGREEAAKVCDELAARYETRADRHVVDHNRDGMLEWSARWNAALNAAAAIRAASPALDVEGMVEIGARAIARTHIAGDAAVVDAWVNSEWERHEHEARAVLASLGVAE